MPKKIIVIDDTVTDRQQVGLALKQAGFDVIEADGDPAAPRLHWLRDAFRADDC